MTARSRDARARRDRVERLGERADLVHLDEDRVRRRRRSMPCCSRSTLVTNRSSPTSWHAVAEPLGEQLPAVPVVLGQAVLDRDDRVAVAQLVVERRPARRQSSVAPLAGQVVARRRGRTRSWPGRARSPIRVARGRRASAASRMAAIASSLDGQVRARSRPRRRPRSTGRARAAAPSARGRSRRRSAAPRRTTSAPDRHDHELLQVDVVVGVRAAVDHVHHRHRQHVRASAPPT